MRKKKKILRPTIVPQRWPGESALATVRQLNARCVTLLAAEKTHDDEALSALWVQVDARACERAGRCPVILIDLNFQRPDWWQRASQRGTDPLATEGARMPDSERAVSLVREILMDAWTISRTMPRALNLVFGMASSVSATIAQLGAPEIDRIAVQAARHLKMRWPESRSFWKGLLEASIGTDDQAFASVHLHALQLLGSDTVSRHG
ncbi:MAG TPA: hypothetical protein VGO37_06570 [Steroidobacteraceae bacterium]|jgi:hypothetical protein|nr:hypothetical protein [Steroidobacteraceae bacterium]